MDKTDFITSFRTGIQVGRISLFQQGKYPAVELPVLGEAVTPKIIFSSTNSGIGGTTDKWTTSSFFDLAVTELFPQQAQGVLWKES